MTRPAGHADRGFGAARERGAAGQPARQWPGSQGWPAQRAPGRRPAPGRTASAAGRQRLGLAGLMLTSGRPAGTGALSHDASAHGPDADEPAVKAAQARVMAPEPGNRSAAGCCGQPGADPPRGPLADADRLAELAVGHVGVGGQGGQRGGLGVGHRRPGGHLATRRAGPPANWPPRGARLARCGRPGGQVAAGHLGPGGQRCRPRRHLPACCRPGRRWSGGGTC